jgi:hypothetical protein
MFLYDFNNYIGTNFWLKAAPQAAGLQNAAHRQARREIDGGIAWPAISSSFSPDAGALAASAKTEDTVRAGRAAVSSPASPQRGVARRTCWNACSENPNSDQDYPT